MKRSKSGDSRTDLANMHIEHEPDSTDVHSIEEAEPDSLAGYQSETSGTLLLSCFPNWPATPTILVGRGFQRHYVGGRKSLLEV